jgi:hypothetical protein
MRRFVATAGFVLLALPALAQQISITGLGPDFSFQNGILDLLAPVEPTATSDVTISDAAHMGQFIPMSGANLKLIIAAVIPASTSQCPQDSRRDRR